MERIFLVSLLLAGCVSPPSTPMDFVPLVSVSVGVAETEKGEVKPEPAPSGVCDNCNGTGKVGDGTVFVPCAVCGGDGKLDESAKPVVEEQEAAPGPLLWMTLAEAKASGKPIMYLATKTSGCEPCNRLKALLDNPISAEALSHFACVMVKDPPANHPWMRHYGIRSFPAMVFVGPPGTQHRVQLGCPDDVPSLLQFLHFMEQRFEGKDPPQVIPDGTKTSIVFPKRPTLAPASHNAVAPTHPKGRSVAGTQERSVLVRRQAPGFWGRATFRPGMGGRR